MINPGSTYRIQFNSEFTFADLAKILPYLKNLGIETIYASPIFKAVPGSNHGYDTTDPNTINPEIGTEEELREISKQVKNLDMNWIQDIVPNHMAYHKDNKWLMDVLEKGPRSIYRNYFDTALSSDLFEGAIMAPFLGKDLHEAIADGEITISYDTDGLHFKYYESKYPLSPASYQKIQTWAAWPKGIWEELNAVKDDVEYGKHFSQLKAAILSRSEIKEVLKNTNKNPEKLQELHSLQHYELCNWQESSKRMNYRRFFTINGLICTNIHREEVFNDFHAKIFQLVEDGVFQGLRIDHIDGLYYPEKYLKDLRKAVGEEIHITVEKILEPGEDLPKHWPVQGTTGYDFLATINNLFTNASGKSNFTKLYRELVADTHGVHQEIIENKTYILENRMSGELDNLYAFFRKLELADTRAVTLVGESRLKKAIGYFLIYCPVYRYYGHSFPLGEDEKQSVIDILRDLSESGADLTPAAALLEHIFCEKPLEGDEKYNERLRRFYMRCMQFSGPLMAKGVEDTSMYTYNRFAGHNEVGDSPETFGMPTESFHRLMEIRQRQWPLALNASSTHDTKRGEDVRMRLSVLTDLDEEWMEAVKHWRKINAGLKQGSAPDANDEYLIYQTLIGALPFPGQGSDHFEDRLGDYLQKALREAKTHTSWAEPNEDYESAAIDFARKLLDPDSEFYRLFMPFFKRVCDFSIVNSLSQILLKSTCPGIPDVYRGTELWDLSLVDPDNRRPVDYKLRKEVLKMFEHDDEDKLWEELYENRYDGRIKMFLLAKLLGLRKEEVLRSGKYIPLKTTGKYSDHIAAYARTMEGKALIFIIPLNMASICREIDCDLQNFDWDDTAALLPESFPSEAYNLLNNLKISCKGTLRVDDIFGEIPLAILDFEKTNSRSAGILMHISSLPSAYGIGDLGPEARKFIDFLAEAKQRYWQILPINPTVEALGHSPYSTLSSMAGNPLFISLDRLAEKGWLDKALLQEKALKATAEVDFDSAAGLRKEMLGLARKRFLADKTEQNRFRAFKSREQNWLHDFALFTIIKGAYNGKAWNQWPDELRDRDASALEEFEANYDEEIEQCKWEQYVFFEQWMSLKKYAAKKRVDFLGDIPIYVTYDSVDVWANRSIFKLGPTGEIKTVAGVPPDYFSETGQLWGMPVFDWEKLAETGYEWWMKRLEVNLRLFDRLRIDHFRAFSEYWEVPASEETAVNGKWVKGPGMDFFEKVRQQFGALAFVAEDLGDISPDVLKLRDELGLPGMKVLQFGFGENMGLSEHIPHNFNRHSIAYTGTHDNNTALGWWRNLDAASKERVSAYLGRTDLKEEEIPHLLCRIALASVADTAILPIQDVMGLDENSRMNTPGSTEGNWIWRLEARESYISHAETLRKWCANYGRG